MRTDLLDPESADMLQRLQSAPPPPTDRLRNIASNLEYQVDHFASGVHSLSILRDTGERLADATLKAAEGVLSARDAERKNEGGAVDVFGALKTLAKVLR